MGALQGNGDRQGIAADPQGLPLSAPGRSGGRARKGFKAADEAVKASLRGRVLTGGVIQERLEAQPVKPAAENPPGAAQPESPRHRNQPAPEQNQGDDG